MIGRQFTYKGKSWTTSFLEGSPLFRNLDDLEVVDRAAIDIYEERAKTRRVKGSFFEGIMTKGKYQTLESLGGYHYTFEAEVSHHDYPDIKRVKLSFLTAERVDHARN